MVWTWDDIERQWLRDGRIAYSAEEAVAAFNLVERTLGREWMKAHNTTGNVDEVWGPGPTATIVRMGLRLASLEGLGGAEELIRRILRKDLSALAELTTVHLLRRDRPSVTVELWPDVTVSGGPRKPDLRVREDAGHPWTYVEVTQPDTSEAEERVQTVMNRVTALIREVRKSFALEVFLRREPTDAEVAAVVNTVRDVCASEGVVRRELPDGLGLLLLNHTEPGSVVLDDHGDAHVPRLARATAIGGGAEPHRHIAVRMAYSDERAERFLGREARQLPTDAPGLIVIQMGRAPGGFKSWEPVIRQRFQPTIHTRVSAVCLLGGGSVATPAGEKLLPQTRLIVNPHAAFQLPQWIADTLTNAGEEYEHYTRPPAA